ncbi:Exodeoxyribonuclease I subunit D [Desulfamplus magnetovallimortis]|uniref:Nuclease SbcCD subunit D n=1 Tax=Desulfamplus magnetovallimortis TaxID=1246637 RepID=A0A1W1HHA4_9BACT|nr:exonuclease SbcCD subunit D C-terminal domain-containing protein [Desulfamplus magnetovallimortis]SLM31859.1 Exodeoxyribonuclease I subunit D [Desulfamplus magnetovallimortis]
MKILHTSDWHLGRSLYGRKRYDEFSAFLDWLGDTIENESIDALVIAGDIFDTGTPGNRAQKLYYQFLCRASNSCCRHIVVIAGNHDSPSFLNAPKELLKALNVYVTGSITEKPDDEVIVLCDEQKKTMAIVCAVPYLRDRDIRTAEPGETIDEKNAKLVEGIKNHYASVCAIADKKRIEYEKAGFSDIPLIATGHLFAAGGKTVDDDGVRELYVGSLTHMGAEIFPPCIDYLALGHLHVPQCVKNTEHMRYCGSPIPMGFGEARHDKKVIMVEFNGKIPAIREIKIPCFQAQEKITGSLDHIQKRIAELKHSHSNAWLEIEYTGKEIVANLREILNSDIADSEMEIRRIKNRPAMERVISAIREDETLDDLDHRDVFVRCLDASDVPDNDREELTASYNEIIISLYEEDVNAE